MSQTFAARLARVQLAIEKLETGAVQEYEIEGRRFKYTDLAALHEREKYLEPRAARETGGRRAFYRGQPG